jgi:hypothetical protein
VFSGFAWARSKRLRALLIRSDLLLAVDGVRMRACINGWIEGGIDGCAHCIMRSHACGVV